MPALPITSVPKLHVDGFKQLGSISKVYFTDMANLELGWDPETMTDIYEINFRDYSGSYTDTSRDSRAGVYDVQRVDFFVPKKRFSVEVIRQKLRDRKIGVIVYDAEGHIFALENATILISYESGRQLSDSAGYTFEIEAQKTGRGYTVLYQIIDLVGEEGSEGGSGDFGGGPVDLPDGGSNPVDDCCVLIHQTTIPEAPPASGNVFNKNRIVTTDAGAKYFIDKNGNSILLNDSIANTAYERIQGTGASAYTPEIIDLTAIVAPQRQLIVERFGAVMQYTESHTPGDPEGPKKWTVEDTDIILDNVFPLETWEYIQILKIA